MKVRNNNIDIIKGISCLCVVLIHYSIPGFIGIYLKVISRFCVPFFFFVSGYFLLNNPNILSSQRLFNKLKHIIRLLFYSGIFHFIFFVLYNIFLIGHNNNIEQYFIKYITKEKLLKFIISNDPFIYGHLWHLLALIYIYLFVYLFNFKNKNLLTNKKFLVFIICFGFLGYIILGEFAGFHIIKTIIPLGNSGKYIIIRNTFFFRALPHFALGILLNLKK